MQQEKEQHWVKFQMQLKKLVEDTKQLPELFLVFIVVNLKEVKTKC